MGSVTLDALGDEIAAIVGDYMADVEDSAGRDVREVAGDVAGDLRASSPRRPGGYAAGWVAEPDDSGASGTAYRVHNRRKPGLTHLLEKGHGGPHAAPAHPHIADAAERGFSELERRLHGS